MRQPVAVLGMTAILSLVAAAAPGGQQADIAGAWDITIVGEAYTFNMIAEFIQEGSELSGTLDGPNGVRELTGSVEGTQVAFSITIPSPEGEFRLDFTGELDGETLAGTMRSPGSEVESPWTGERRP